MRGILHALAAAFLTGGAKLLAEDANHPRRRGLAGRGGGRFVSGRGTTADPNVTSHATWPSLSTASKEKSIPRSGEAS